MEQVTVEGTRTYDPNQPGGGGGSHRGDPHGPGKGGPSNAAATIRRLRGLPDPLDLNTVPLTPPAPEPSPSVPYDPGGYFSLPLPDGGQLTPSGKSFYAPGADLSTRPDIAQARDTSMQPVLEQVTVTSRRPPPGGTMPRATSPAGFASLNWLFRPFNPAWLLIVPNPTGKPGSENKRARDALVADLANRILPVTPSVTRLPEPIAEVVVTASTGSRPSTSRVAPTLEPLSPSGLSKVRVGFISQPTSRVLPKPQRVKLPSPVQGTYNFLIGDPYVSPLPTPGSRPGARPFRPQIPAPGSPLAPFAPLVPSYPPTFSPNPVGIPTPLAQFQPSPTGRCQCTTTQQKPKPRKKTPPRTVCYRGTYVENSTGLTKKKLEQVPCVRKSSSSTKSMPSASTRTKRKSPPGAFPGLGV